MQKSTVFTGGGMDYGVNGTGADVIFYGDTAGKDMKWDQSEDHLLFKDSTYLKFGTGGDLQFYHNGTNSYLTNATGDLYIGNGADDKRIRFQCDDGAGGLTTYFDMQGSAATHDGSATTALFTQWYDNSKIALGNGYDVQLWHDGTNTTFYSQTGNLTFQQAADDADMIFQCDDGSGGTTPYITLDGGANEIHIHKTMGVGTTSPDTAYKIDIAGKAQVQSVLELDDVLTLNAISTPSDPAAGKSSIYMDSADGAIKVKINVGGTVVTRTLASYEG